MCFLILPCTVLKTLIDFATKSVTLFFIANGVVVSFAAVFWMSRNAPPKEEGALRDIQKTAAKETNGVAMSSPVHPVLTDIFLGVLLRKLDRARHSNLVQIC